jgi:hypothetical protein
MAGYRGMAAPVLQPTGTNQTTSRPRLFGIKPTAERLTPSNSDTSDFWLSGSTRCAAGVSMLSVGPARALTDCGHK